MHLKIPHKCFTRAARIVPETVRFVGCAEVVGEEKTLTKVIAAIAAQKSANALPTQVCYTFECLGIQLDTLFTAPLQPDNLEPASRPVS